jgi:hypothetical protein
MNFILSEQRDLPYKYVNTAIIIKDESQATFGSQSFNWHLLDNFYNFGLSNTDYVRF